MMMHRLHYYSTKNVLLVAFFVLCFVSSNVQGRRLRVLMSDGKHEHSQNLVKEVPYGETRLPESGEKKLEHKQITTNPAKEVSFDDTLLSNSGEKKNSVTVGKTKLPDSGQKELDDVEVDQHKQMKLSDSDDDFVRVDYTPMSNKPPVHN
ncbi:hypothetical protein LINGRAHAP2_LOCUS9199 [Linum grandiflorum]